MSRRFTLAATVACAALTTLSVILLTVFARRAEGLAGGAIVAAYSLMCIVPAVIIALISAGIAIVNRIRKDCPLTLLAFAPLGIIGLAFTGLIAMFALREKPQYEQPRLEAPPRVQGEGPPVKSSSSLRVSFVPSRRLPRLSRIVYKLARRRYTKHKSSWAIEPMSPTGFVSRGVSECEQRFPLSGRPRKRDSYSGEQGENHVGGGPPNWQF